MPTVLPALWVETISMHGNIVPALGAVGFLGKILLPVIAGLKYEVDELVVDEKKQQIAVRLSISGVPQNKNLQKNGPDGKVAVYEHAFIRVLIHDFLKEAKDPDAQRRINSTTEVNCISGPYFDQEQAKQVREAIVDVDLPINPTAPTQVDYEGDENEESDLRVRITGLTVEEAIETVMNGFLDKRRASGDARPCGPHDLDPIYAALFGSLGTTSMCTGPAIQMSAPGGSPSDRSDAASPMSTASDTSDEGVELEIDDSSAYTCKEDNDLTLDDRMYEELGSPHAIIANDAGLLRTPNRQPLAQQTILQNTGGDTMLLEQDYTLFLAPIDEKKMHRVLDIGTGTGISWAIEMGDASMVCIAPD
ncbi:hypothetical protein CSAL01_09383 [Colletotrichum salicis]|uniref:Uncharacterized protein n=1 Tax=Colletotrichum salicis TaxID=1209931 RepID=A0A135V206_9PEZI|nr:hypothetical protein CSAL01_09383 [Colletotrichum salicis]